ncbi:AfsA-related hotdog domain-containing protein [Streptomyces lasalocidi]
MGQPAYLAAHRTGAARRAGGAAGAADPARSGGPGVRRQRGDLPARATADGGLAARLVPDTTHPVMFDHWVDHVPGMLELEACRATGGRRLRRGRGAADARGAADGPARPVPFLRRTGPAPGVPHRPGPARRGHRVHAEPARHARRRRPDPARRPGPGGTGGRGHRPARRGPRRRPPPVSAVALPWSRPAWAVSSCAGSARRSTPPTGCCGSSRWRAPRWPSRARPGAPPAAPPYAPSASC